MQYTYDGGKAHIIYFWQGRDSSADEKGASALLAKELGDSLGGQAALVSRRGPHTPLMHPVYTPHTSLRVIHP